jgi:hypothetical protein
MKIFYINESIKYKENILHKCFNKYKKNHDTWPINALVNYNEFNENVTLEHIKIKDSKTP